MARRGMHFYVKRRGEKQELLAGKRFAWNESCACRGRCCIDGRMTNFAQTDGEVVGDVL